MARFAGKSDLLDRLSHDLSDGTSRLVLLIGPDLAPARPPWNDVLLRAADGIAQLKRNEELREELRHVPATAEPVVRLALYRAAFADVIGPEEFDLVVQHAVLERYRGGNGRMPADLPPGRPLTAEAAAGLERDMEAWQLSEGLLALGRLVEQFRGRLEHRVLTAGLDPGIMVALRRRGVAVRPTTPYVSDGLATTTKPGAVDVVHLLGYWRPLDAAQRRAPLPDHRLTDLPDKFADRVRSRLAGATVYVLGYGGGDPIIERMLQAAVADGARVHWAVPDENADTDARIRVLADRIGGESVTFFCGVDSDHLLRILAAQLAGEQYATEPPELPPPRFYEQPALLRSLGAVPLRTPAAGAEDLLRQLDKRFGWRLERPASPAPKVLFWPVRLREPSVIHMVQAMAAAALSVHGVRVVLALDDFGTLLPSRDAFEERVRAWFRLIPGAQEPDVEPLQAWLDRQRLRPASLRERPTDPWAVLQEYYGQRKPTAYETLRAAKIIPDIEPREAAEHAPHILDMLRTTGVQRLLTAPALWSFFNHLLLDRRIVDVMTLAGDDERTFWRHRLAVTGEPTRHLYHPRMVDFSQDSGRIRWDHHLDLQEHIEQAVGGANWRRPDRYLPWLVRHAFLLPEYLRDGGGARLEGHEFDAWQDVLSALEDDQGLTGPLARRISGWFLGEPD
ncbi:SIR2 family protein [Actinoplanes sp. RD1]|uniref:hypothetical protein n=1 Tax=Actinoplanes sp. RD1 TaxID=3064538 RepID=UPI0027421A23|nr:hypothetical protein [Actinoplanes sp. RD1]